MFKISRKLLCRSMILVTQHTPLATERFFIRIPKYYIGASFSDDTKQSRTLKSPLANLLVSREANIPATTDHSLPIETPPTEEDDKKKREESWRKMKITLSIFGVSFTCLGLYLIIELGRPRKDEFGRKVPDRFTTMPLIKQYIYRTISELNYYGQLLKEPSREKLLPDPLRPPYFQPKYTLIMEFTDVLVHPEWGYQTGWRFKKRPGLDFFLESVAGTYEIVVYTAEQGMTVFPIVEVLDPKNYINYKLVRDATLFIDGQHVKDLDKLNRDLNHVVVVDWNEDCTKYHRENVLCIPRWDGNDNDTTLVNLASFLLTIANSDIDDVREVMRNYNQFDDPLQEYRERQRKMLEAAETRVTAKAPLPTQLGSRWMPTFMRKE